MSNVEKLKKKFEELKTKDLQDLKVWVVGPSEAPDSVTLEEVCGEVLDILEAHEQGKCVDISDKLR